MDNTSNNDSVRESTDKKSLYKGALAFWDKWYGDEKPERSDDTSLGCPVLEEKLDEIAAEGIVLDYGCGSGWASVCLAQKGANVTGVDQSTTAIKAANEYAVIYELEDKIRFKRSDESCLNEFEDGHFGGMFSSNTLDVIPRENAESILKAVHRVLKHGADIVIMLNPYADEDFRAKRNMIALGEDQYTMNGVLRCVNKTREDWIEFTKPWFEFVSYEDFRFDGEPQDLNRRLFVFRNR